MKKISRGQGATGMAERILSGSSLHVLLTLLEIIPTGKSRDCLAGRDLSAGFACDFQIAAEAFATPLSEFLGVQPLNKIFETVLQLVR